MKILYLIRHAKSSKDIPNIKDEERPLNEIGKKEAHYIGSQLKKNNIKIECFYSSHAKRALDTAKIIANEIGFPEENINIVNEIYKSDINKLLKIIRSIKDEFSTVAVFGHNPEFLEFLNYISGSKIEEFPTCAVYEVYFDIPSWKYVEKNSGKITFMIHPKI